MSQGKTCKQYLENTDNKAELILQNTLIKTTNTQNEKGNVLLNSRDAKYRMNSSELKTLLTSNHEEAETKIVCFCSSFSKRCIVKAKYTNLTLFNFDDL